MQLELERPKEAFSVDTSSFMAINENYEGVEREVVWAHVIELITQGRLKTTRVVMVELKRNDADAHARLIPHRRTLVVSDSQLAAAAGRIARQFPKMSRPLSPREKADQWVVALGQVKGLTVVTQEANAPGKIPATCRALELDCIRLDQMLARADRPA